ncbi:unnamed protein product [Penicillium salamii]|uniref:Uncharacterized protein n=1 Tax=Penicillium salamii TaxID=1612424 RepID=A0A9W4JTS2_9EURO|nr:unnamed protein product [Penicillium salamii]
MISEVDRPAMFDDLGNMSNTEKPFRLTVDPISEPVELPSPPLSKEFEVMHPNRNGFSGALSCYPIAKEIARAIDLTTLHALSGTCRQFHANLAPYRYQLARETLRCENEGVGAPTEPLDDGDYRREVRKCVRDVVGECCFCAKVICKNCVEDPAIYDLLQRIRRLCQHCVTVPLSLHLAQLSEPAPWDEESVAAIAFARTPCNCEDAPWVCGSQPCNEIRQHHGIKYRRAWAWHAKHGEHNDLSEYGWFGKCGRDENCLAAQEIEIEDDSEIEEEFVGDSVKQKSKRRLIVAADVVDYDDEKKNRYTYLDREREGLQRAWCAWCSKVIPGKSETF